MAQEHIDEMSDAKIAEVLEILAAHGVGAECPACTGGRMIAQRWFAVTPLAGHVVDNVLEAKNAIHSVVLLCDHCGHVRLHSIGTLGVTP